MIEFNQEDRMQQFSPAPKTTKAVVWATAWKVEISHRVPQYGTHVLIADLHGPAGDEITVEAKTDADLERAAMDAIRFVDAENVAGECLV